MRLDDENLGAYLDSLDPALGLGRAGEPVRVTGAGDGNINFVRRVAVGQRAFVLKQARSSLERFPEYEVGTERIVFEHRYGQAVAEYAPDEAVVPPRVLHFDDDARVLVLEDLGDGPRLDGELAAGRVPGSALAALGRFLGAVHAGTRAHARELAPRFANDEMRALHGEHIFTLPYQENDFPRSAELRSRADKELGRPDVRNRIAALREHYYGAAFALVHADVQAGNILLPDPEGSPRLLDAEIAHVGDPAFDLGTALAHVWVHVPLAADPGPLERGGQALLAAYAAAGGRDDDLTRARSYAGVEIIRRSIGAARLPVLADDAAAAAALTYGTTLLCT